jgi:hypothetical protein
MLTSVNTGLNVVGAGLIALGTTSIQENLWAGAIEIILGIALYFVYEKLPPSVK